MTPMAETPDHTELRRLAEAATQGPWRVVTDLPALAIIAGNYRVVQTPNQNNSRHFGAANRWDGIENETNAAYIAAANPTAIIAVLDHVAKLEAALASTRDDEAGKIEAWLRGIGNRLRGHSNTALTIAIADTYVAAADAIRTRSYRTSTP